MSRRIVLTILATITFALAVLAHPPGRAFACSCVPSPPPAEAAGQSQAVFSGTVVTVGTQPAGQAGMPVLVTFDLKETWKGPNGPQLTLGTSGSSASCGYEFVTGEEYLVYATIQDGQLTTSLCSRTAPLADAGVDLAALGPGTAPNTGVTGPEGGAPEPAAPAGLPWAPIGLGVVGLAAIAAVGVVLVRRRAA